MQLAATGFLAAVSMHTVASKLQAGLGCAVGHGTVQFAYVEL